MILNCASYTIDLSKRTHIMGILNITPDSFYDGGLYYNREKAVKRAINMEEEGADIIDIGGESTRPGSKSISAKEEIKRILPVINKIIKRLKIPISIDTYKSEVAKAALDSGASIVNDITGLRDEKTAALVKEYNAGVVLMHMKGMPSTMQKNPEYKNLIDDIRTSLKESISIAKGAGIKDSQIIIDPGIGFGKTPGHNLKLLKRLKEFKSLKFPILIGPSRKSFIGAVLGLSIDKRLIATVAAVAISIYNGANIVRVHDVKKMFEVARLTDAIKNA